MNALKRFYLFGAEAADRRVAEVLAPPALAATDRYLMESAVVTAVDRITLRLQSWWLASEANRLSSLVRARALREPLAVRRQAVALVILIAVVVHVSLTLMQGAHTGWFWLILPAMAALFASLLLAGSRASGPTG